MLTSNPNPQPRTCAPLTDASAVEKIAIAPQRGDTTKNPQEKVPTYNLPMVPAQVG